MGTFLLETTMEDQLIETWNVHDRINRYLLNAGPDEALGLSLKPKHRTAYQLLLTFITSGCCG